MSTTNVAIVEAAFAAVEHRDRPGLEALYHPEIEFHWPPGLPACFEEVYSANQLQPTDAERSMDPRVVAASDTEVVVLWRFRGVNPTGARVEQPVLGLYQVRDNKFARAQMFFWDPEAVTRLFDSTRRSTT